MSSDFFVNHHHERNKTTKERRANSSFKGAERFIGSGIFRISHSNREDYSPFGMKDFVEEQLNRKLGRKVIYDRTKPKLD